MGQLANLLKTNFSAGEVSPSMFGRVDTKRHQNGAAEVQNFVVRPQGPLVRRMGSAYLGEVKSSANATRLIPFQFSNTQTYALEFGNNVIRFWKDKALILSAGVPIELASPYSSADVAAIYFAQSADVIYLAHPSYPPQKLSRLSDTSWTIANAKFDDGPYRAQTDVDKQVTFWLTSILVRATLKSTVAEFVVGDVGKYIEYWKGGFLYIGKVITYVNTTTVTIEPVENIVDVGSLDRQAVITYNNFTKQALASLAIWSSETEYNYIKIAGQWLYLMDHSNTPLSSGGISYDVMNVNATKPTVKVTTGKMAYSAEVRTAVLNSSSAAFTTVQDVGRQFRMFLSNRAVWGTITTVSSTVQCVVALGSRVPTDPRNGLVFLNDASTLDWRLGAWYVGNYPRAVTFHQGRLVFAGTTLEPNRGWMSESDDYVSFATSNLFSEVIDSSSINFGIASGSINTILWLQSGSVLIIGTVGEEFVVKPSSSGDTITPSNISITTQTSYGSKENIRPIKVGPAVIFAQQHGQRIRELSYDYQIDSYMGNDITIVSEHIFRKHLSAGYMAYQQIPNSIIWFTCQDGNLVSLTYEKEQEVYAWANHSLGGSGFVESIIALPSPTLNQDEVYMIVRRTINGATKRYVEVLSPEYSPTSVNDYVGMKYLDCHLSKNQAASTTVTELGHLEGQTVQVLANYAVHPDCVVASGQITLNYAATNVTVGYGFTSYVKTLSMEGGDERGTAQGKLKKIKRVDIELLSSIGIGYGRTLTDAGQARPFRESEAVLGAPPTLFTGFKQLTDDSGFNADGQFYILQGQPYPLSILSLMPIYKINE